MNNRHPINMFDYVMLKGEGNKGASYKPSWKPDWRSPPGVSQKWVFLGVVGILSLAAIPVWGLPYLRGDAPQKASESGYVIRKQRLRAERDKWIYSDEMPEK